MPRHARIIAIETDPSVIRELCDYDRGFDNELSDRAMRSLDMITMPKNSDDNTSTALGFVAMLANEHPSRRIPKEHVTFSEYLVRTSRLLRAYELYPGIPNPAGRFHRPDGVYTLIPEEQGPANIAQQERIAA